MKSNEESYIKDKLLWADQFCYVGVMVIIGGLTMFALGQDYSSGNQIVDICLVIVSLLMLGGGVGLFIKGYGMSKKYGPEKERIDREKDKEWRTKRGSK